MYVTILEKKLLHHKCPPDERHPKAAGELHGLLNVLEGECLCYSSVWLLTQCRFTL